MHRSNEHVGARHSVALGEVFLALVCLTVSTATRPVRAQLPCQETKLLASDGERGDFFGTSLCIDGDRIVVGAYGDNDNGLNSGSAYVFRWVDGVWENEAKLKPAGGEGFDYFGLGVALAGDRIVTGAYGDGDNFSEYGAAYVFRWNGTEWTQEGKLLADHRQSETRFGFSVALSGDRVAVGAYRDNENGRRSGAAYAFRWNGSKWIQEAKLLPDDGAENDKFGYAVAAWGDRIAVGAYNHFGPNDEDGAVYVFHWNGVKWTQEATITVLTRRASLGRSLSFSGDRIVAGAARDSENGQYSGAAYVFRRDGSEWTQEAKLLPDDAAEGGLFGNSVAVSGDQIVVAARFDDENGPNAGAAYVFRWNGRQWVQKAKLLASDGAEEDRFGDSVAVSGNRVVVGVSEDDDNGLDSGSAYVFNADACEVDCDLIRRIRLVCHDDNKLIAKILTDLPEGVALRIDNNDRRRTAVVNDRGRARAKWRRQTGWHVVTIFECPEGQRVVRCP